MTNKKRLELLALNIGSATAQEINRKAVIDAYEESQRDILRELNLIPHKPSQK